MSKWAFNCDSGEYEEIDSMDLAGLEVNIFIIIMIENTIVKSEDADLFLVLVW